MKHEALHNTSRYLDTLGDANWLEDGCEACKAGTISTEADVVGSEKDNPCLPCPLPYRCRNLGTATCPLFDGSKVGYMLEGGALCSGPCVKGFYSWDDTCTPCPSSAGGIALFVLVPLILLLCVKTSDPFRSWVFVAAAKQLLNFCQVVAIAGLVGIPPHGAWPVVYAWVTSLAKFLALDFEVAAPECFGAAQSGGGPSLSQPFIFAHTRTSCPGQHKKKKKK